MEKPVNEGESKAPTLQIRSPYFIAALVFDEDRERVVRADRDLDFMVGWTMEKVMCRIQVENWQWKVIRRVMCCLLAASLRA